MAIVKMKKLRLLALVCDRESILKELMSAGCVQITESDMVNESDVQALVSLDASDDAELMDRLSDVNSALQTLDKYAPQKSKLLSSRPYIREHELYDSKFLKEAVDEALAIKELGVRITALESERGRQFSRIAMLRPWEGTSVPLETASFENCYFSFGVLPASVDTAELKSALETDVPEFELVVSSSNPDQHYILFACHNRALDSAMNTLTQHGFTSESFPELSGTALDNIEEAERLARECEKNIGILAEKVKSKAAARSTLRRAYDMLSVRRDQNNVRPALLKTELAFYLQGWVPENKCEEIERIICGFQNAHEFIDPLPDEDVPVLLRNSKLISSMNLVTEMYSLPKYSNIDPNPLIFPFFPIFFGVMYSDLAYGLILFIASWIVLSKARPRGAVKQIFELGRVVGVTSAVSGLLFGGFFGDAVTVIAETFFGAAPGSVVLPSIINPVNDPMLVLGCAIAVGVLQIFVGMCIKVYLLLRDHKPLDALFDVGSWWILFAGIAVWYFLGFMWLALLGVLMLLLTQGRKSKTVGGKIAGGLASIYNITSYFSDILSYSRLMALMLASSVIASVVNSLGSGAGWFFFIIIFIVGHSFNMLISLIGSYVHGARLQYLEYFSKFYDGGGRAFEPLRLAPRYFDIYEER